MPGAQYSLGGHVDRLHGEPVECRARVVRLADGRFTEPEPRHGGIRDFDQGPTAVIETDDGITVMLTSRRMVPFSLNQLRFCGLEPGDFDVLVAKGVNAPLAAYDAVCSEILRVDTPGSTRADMTQLCFEKRRRPLFPFERDTRWNVGP